MLSDVLTALFIPVPVLFNKELDEEEERVRDLIGKEVNEQEVDTVYVNLSDIVAFNSCHKGSHTRLILRSGSSFVMNLTPKEFILLLTETVEKSYAIIEKDMEELKVVQQKDGDDQIQGGEPSVLE